MYANPTEAFCNTIQARTSRNLELLSTSCPTPLTSAEFDRRDSKRTYCSGAEDGSSRGQQSENGGGQEGIWE